MSHYTASKNVCPSRPTFWVGRYVWTIFYTMWILFKYFFRATPHYVCTGCKRCGNDFLYSQGLRDIATRIHNATCLLAKGLRESGNEVQTGYFFDTLKVSPRLDITEIKHRATEMKINFRYFPDETVGISIGETITRTDVRDILWVFGTPKVRYLDHIAINISQKVYFMVSETIILKKILILKSTKISFKFSLHIFYIFFSFRPYSLYQ